MADSEGDYQVGPGRPPLHTRFRQPRRPQPRSLPALLADALNETVVITIDGRRARSPSPKRSSPRWSTNRRVPILRATEMLLDMMKDVEHKAGDAAPPRRLAAADKEVVQLFMARLRRQILQEIEEAKPAEPPG
jgi:hypothetical protein